MYILITGAGRGLGKSMAQTAVNRGHIVLAGARSLAHDGLAALQRAHPEQVIPIQLEVTDEASVERAAQRAEDEIGQLDAIINNAAVLLERDSPIELLDMRAMAESMDVNLYGPMRVVKHFLPLLRKRGSGGSILNISSEAGSFHLAYGADYPYAISKAALNLFTQRLHKAYSAEGIRSIAVHPGWMQTDMGGANAQLDPMESASALMDIVEGKEVEIDPFAFVDYTGRSFPI